VLRPYGEIASFCGWGSVGGMDTSVDEAYSLRMTLSARNRLEGKVVEIEFGGVMAHVVVSVGKNLIESVITKRSAEEMKLKVGDTVSAVIKSTEVMLEKS
jgi:molybdopterin-binding protein